MGRRQPGADESEAIKQVWMEGYQRGIRDERSGTRDILEEAEDLLALYETAARPNAAGDLFIRMPAHEFVNALNVVRRAQSMEDKDHE